MGTAPRRDAALWMALCTELKPEAGDLGEAGACAGAVSAFELTDGLGASGEPEPIVISGGTSTGAAV